MIHKTQDDACLLDTTHSSSIAVFVNVAIDRLMINYYLSLEEVGLYGIGYRLASVSTLVLVGFQMALTPLSVSITMNRRHHTSQLTIFRTFLAIAVVIFLILSFRRCCPLDPRHRRIMLPAKWSSSWYCNPALADVHLCAGIGIAKKTHLFVWINAGGAILNIFFNWMLIPRVGYVGAGIATLMGYACVFGAYMVTARNSTM